MAKRTTRGGRVTPKGTAEPRNETSTSAPPAPRTAARGQIRPERVRRSTGFVARPVTHHRGNR